MKKTIFTLVLLAFIGLSTANAQLGIGTTNPAESSILDLTATNKALLLSRVATVNEISSPVNGMIVYEIFNECIRGFEAGAWSDCLNGSPAIAVISSGACVGEPVSFTFNGKEYRPIESAGQCWLDRNLGADRVATSPTDVNAYGDLYQWGRNTDGHQIRTSPVTEGPVTAGTEASNFVVNDGAPFDWLSTQDATRWGNPTDTDKGIHDPCPNGYRVPSSAELDTERLSWTTINVQGAYDSPLKFTLTGYRIVDSGGFFNVNQKGMYWSSTPIDNRARYMNINDDGNQVITVIWRARAKSIRCIKN